MTSKDRPGEVITFFSYKGGTGRSMSLANVACILATSHGSAKNPILMIDWDLDAPGLHNYFKNKIPGNETSILEEKPGLIDLFIDIKNVINDSCSDTKNYDSVFEKLNIEDYILRTDIDNLFLIKAGRFDKDYSNRVQEFKWIELFNRNPGLIRYFANYLCKYYKYILVDSRTGITDIGGITTALMPNRLVAVFTPNRQSIAGVLDVSEYAVNYRIQSDDPRPLIIFPLPSRIEASEPELKKQWREGYPEKRIIGYQPEFEKLFKEIYKLKQCNMDDYFENVQIQHVPSYSYGEEIAVLNERTNDRLSLTKSYEYFAWRLVSFDSPWEIPLTPCQIPLPPPDFVGRKIETSIMLNRVDQGATILCIRGMGGVGKTALALKLSDMLRDRFPDGLLLIELQGTSKAPLPPEEAMSQVIRALSYGFRMPVNKKEIMGQYLSVLAGKRVLLLLDNAGTREQIESLIPPRGSIALITSRNKFALPGINELDLDILPADEACELLLRIAKRIGDRADELAKLCGYLPLALRNVAGILAERRDLSVSEYEVRLKDARKRLELVAASFSLSYNLLPSTRKRQWCRLSVFPGDFDRAGAKAVLKMAIAPSNEALSDLVKWSLVEFMPASDSDNGRFRLHDLARLFSESQCLSIEYVDAQKQHAKYYIKVLSEAERLYLQGGKNTLVGLELFDREWMNIRSGQTWARGAIQNAGKSKRKNAELNAALQLANSYPFHGESILGLRLHPRERIQWLETALYAARHMGQLDKEEMHLENLGYAYSDLGEIREALAYFERALAIAQKIEFKKGEVAQLNNLGNSLFALGEVLNAIGTYEQALKISRNIKNRQGEANALGNLGNAYLRLGEIPKAIEYYEQVLKIFREIGNRRGEANSLGNLGSAYSDLGEIPKAIEYNEHALKIFREIGDRRGEANALGSLGIAYLRLSEVPTAIEYYEHALKIFREIGDRRGEANALGNLGNAYLHLGEIPKAIEYCDRTLMISSEIGNRQGEANALGNLGNAYLHLGKIPTVIEYYEQALKIFREIGDRRGEANALGNLGSAYAYLGETRKAIGTFEQALKISLDIRNRQGEVNALGNLGSAYSALGEVRKAIEFHEQALKITQEIGNRRSEGAHLGNLGLAYADLGETHKAIEYYEQALKITQGIGDKQGEGENLSNLGKARLDLNEYGKAIEYCQQSLDIVRKIEYRRIEGEALCNLGSVYANKGESNKSIDYCNQALEIFKKMEYRRGEGDALFCKSLALHELGQRQEAVDGAKAALQIFEQIESPHAEKVRQKLAEWQASSPKES